MYMSNICFLLIAVCAWGVPSLHAAYTVKEGKLVNKEEVATLSVQEHYSAATDAYQKKNWEELIKQALIVHKNFPGTPFAHEALFYLGVGYFHLEDCEVANKYFTSYLHKQVAPKYFEEAIQLKFAIAGKYDKGAKKHLLGMKSMPKWVPAREDALAIYDEVITALPHHDLAAQALLGKARLFLKDEEYKSSVEAYQMLIRRFPKHELTPESYLGIANVYLIQCRKEYPDADFLDLAEINLRKFRQEFPREEKVTAAEKLFLEMQETYAQNLYETAQFYERTNKSNAARIYYSKIVSTFPQTKTAELSEKRLKTLPPQK